MMIFIMMTATLAGCTGDDEPRLSKEELVEQIRNGHDDIESGDTNSGFKKIIWKNNRNPLE